MNKTLQSNSYRGFEKTLLNTWISTFEGMTGKNFLQSNLLTCLKDFDVWAVKQKEKAYELAKPQLNNLQGILKTNFETWLEEKISKMLDIYWAPLSQAATQYTSPAYHSDLAKLIEVQGLEDKILHYLTEINKLTNAPDLDKLTINDILLFFDELTLIRRHPYTKMAFISIPFRVIKSGSSLDEKLAGIAHELGHFVYWRLDSFDKINDKQKKDKELIVKALLSEPYNHPPDKEIRFVKPWIEEMFADYIGAKIAGDTYVKSGKDMVIRGNKSGDTLGENDQEHVPDVLRPLVSMHTIHREREKALDMWRAFFKDEYPVDLAKIAVTAPGENENQRAIQRSPEQLTGILMDTIDLLSEKIVGTDEQSLLKPTFAAIYASQEILAQKASVLAGQSKNKKTDLDIFLEPLILEAGDESHSHTFNKGHHKNDPYTFTHAH